MNALNAQTQKIQNSFKRERIVTLFQECNCCHHRFYSFEAEAIRWLVCEQCGRWWKNEELEKYNKDGVDWTNS